MLENIPAVIAPEYTRVSNDTAKKFIRKMSKPHYCPDCASHFARPLKHSVCAKCYATMQRAGG